MGLLSGLGKGAFGVGKLGAGIAGGTTKAIGKSSGAFGKQVMNNIVANPGKALATGAAFGAAGYGLAEMDGRNDKHNVTGKALLTGAAAMAIPGMSTVGAVAGAGIVAGASGVASVAHGLGRASLKVPGEAVSFSNMKDIKFSGIGKGLLVGGAAVEGISRAVGKYEQIRMGTNDGMMRTAAPMMPQPEQGPSYANNGGATGDLVFDMYNNR